MIYSEESLTKDIERIRQISIIPTVLDIICQLTGMGFAAVARVTEERWIACSVRDDINFGLVPGGELKVETTICHEIQGNHQPVVIDHVAENESFCNHPTPLMYGFQSYISFPIFLKTGEFFGTLCAIDPRPAQLENNKVMGTFRLFSDLIAFHLQQIDFLEQSDQAVYSLSRQLTNSLDENRQYRHISNHNLQEPLRKIQLFSSMLVDAANWNDIKKVQGIAGKIFSGAGKLSMMIKDLTSFSELDAEDVTVELVDLNELITRVWQDLSSQVQAKKAIIQLHVLPSIPAVRSQMEQLFYQLLHNVIKFSRKDVAPIVVISGEEVAATELGQLNLRASDTTSKYIEIRIADNGIGIESSQVEKIFDMFAQVPHEQVREGGGFGLTYCRKIVQQHNGLIKAQSDYGRGTTVSVILPIS